ncbi:MAG: mobile mystery protein B [Cyclobacteriaceae bacterium]
MGLNIEYEYGQTTLEEDEKDGLLIPTITTQKELDELEQMNVEKAVQWSLVRKFSVDQIFSERFVRELHRKMFGEVWRWAGKFRRTNKNIGVDRYQIGIQLKYLLDDVKHWTKNDIYPPDEIAVRFKHRLVKIHCFSNGNGRHSRLMADIIAEHIFHKPIFSWGYGHSFGTEELRAEYIGAIKEADKGLIQPLVDFART